MVGADAVEPGEGGLYAADDFDSLIRRWHESPNLHNSAGSPALRKNAS